MRPPPAPPKYATDIPGRRVQFKTHRTLGHAKLAVGSGWGDRVIGGKVYEWAEGEWMLIADIPLNSRKDAHDFFLGTDGGPQDVERKHQQAIKNLEFSLLHARERVEKIENELEVLKAKDPRKP